MGDHVYLVMIATNTHQALPSVYATFVQYIFKTLRGSIQSMKLNIIIFKMIDTIHETNKPHISFLYFLAKTISTQNLEPLYNKCGLFLGLMVLKG